MTGAHTPGLVVIDPFTLQLIRQGDGAVIFEVPENSAIPRDELLANLDRVSALWNTFLGTHMRSEAELAEEIGQRVIGAADDLTAFAPDLEATFPFEIDDKPFSIIIRRGELK